LSLANGSLLVCYSFWGVGVPGLKGEFSFKASNVSSKVLAFSVQISISDVINYQNTAFSFFNGRFHYARVSSNLPSGTSASGSISALKKVIWKTVMVIIIRIPNKLLV
jgi:hypothetical protein